MGYSGFYSEKANNQTMTWQPAKEPDQIRFFELDFVTNGKTVGLKLVNSGVASVSGWKEAGTALATAIAKGFPAAAKPFYKKDRQPGKPWPLGISLAAPVPRPGGSGYGAAKQCLYVIKLAGDETPSNTDWHFSRSYAPFSLGDRNWPRSGSPMQEPPVALQDLFSHACLIDPATGALIQPKPGELDEGDQYPVTRWACFLFDFETAQARLPGEFALRYNTHIELFDSESGEYAPLMIDPDIGIPGGNWPGGDT